jgi:predicted RNA-binding Zn-ribbon protein involved in translation (DUF1610 family)
MTSALVKVVMCDVCGTEGAVERALSLDGRRWDVDLCPAHAEPLTALETLLEAHGRAKRASKPRGRRAGRHVGRNWSASNRGLLAEFRTCPKCGTVPVTRQALSVHANQHHDSTLGALERAYGTTYRCPGCEFVGAYPALGQHASQAGHSLDEPGA